MKNGNHLFTSECVTEGHPDKMADQISDAVLDAALKDERLYAVLALFDAIRSGQAREREAAQKLLEPFFQ